MAAHLGSAPRLHSPLAATTHHQAVHAGFCSTLGRAHLATPRCRSSPRLVASAASSNGTGPSVSTALPPTPKPAPSPYRVSFFDAMRFNGPAPEIINGRLAMIGFVAGAIQEAETGQTLLYQLEHASVSTLLVTLLWVYASMVPILKGAKNEPFNIFTPRAELTNGRAAMLAMAAILAMEYKAGVPFF